MLEDTTKAAQLIAAADNPGVILTEFWESLSPEKKFEAFYRLHEINKAQFRNNDGAEILRRYTRPDND